MPTTKLVQISTWTDKDLKKAFITEIKRQGKRISVSSYLESLIRRHLEAKGSI